MRLLLSVIVLHFVLAVFSLPVDNLELSHAHDKPIVERTSIWALGNVFEIAVPRSLNNRDPSVVVVGLSQTHMLYASLRTKSPLCYTFPASKISQDLSNVVKQIPSRLYVGIHHKLVAVRWGDARLIKKMPDDKSKIEGTPLDDLLAHLKRKIKGSMEPQPSDRIQETEKEKKFFYEIIEKSTEIGDIAYYDVTEKYRDLIGMDDPPPPAPPTRSKHRDIENILSK